MAIPGFFAPVKMGDMVLVDGEYSIIIRWTWPEIWELI